MKNVYMKIYNDGAEFLDDVLSNVGLKKGLDKQKFYDFIYYRIIKLGTLFYEKIDTNYDLLGAGSSEGQYLVNNKKTLYEWYNKWEEKK